MNVRKLRLSPFCWAYLPQNGSAPSGFLRLRFAPGAGIALSGMGRKDVDSSFEATPPCLIGRFSRSSRFRTVDITLRSSPPCALRKVVR